MSRRPHAWPSALLERLPRRWRSPSRTSPASCRRARSAWGGRLCAISRPLQLTARWSCSTSMRQSTASSRSPERDRRQHDARSSPRCSVVPTEPEQRLPHESLPRRGAPGRARGSHGGRGREGGGDPCSGGATGCDARRGAFPRSRRAAMTGGRAALGRFRLTPLQPVKPMLAQTADDLDERPPPRGRVECRVEARRCADPGTQATETRCGSSRGTSRTSSDRVPEIVEAVRGLPVTADRARRRGDRPSRRRSAAPVPGDDEPLRVEGSLAATRAPLPAFFFDCLHVDGEDLLDRPAAERLVRLAERLPGGARRPAHRDGRRRGGTALSRRGARARATKA